MNVLEKVLISQQVEKMLNASSSCFSEVIWEHLKHCSHPKFVKKIEEYIGVELLSDEEVDSIYFKSEGNLVHTPTNRDIDNKVRHQYKKLQKSPRLLNEIKSDINDLIHLVSSKNPRTLIFREACNIYRKSWQGACLDYPLYNKKKNGNCLLSVLSTVNALMAYIAGIDNFSPCELLSSVKKTDQIDVLCHGWFSVPAVIMGLNTARKAQLPTPKRQLEMMLEMSINNPSEIASWSDDTGVVTGTAIKNFAEITTQHDVSCDNFHADLQIIGEQLIVTAVHLVDKNGYALKKKIINANSEILSQVQDLVNRLKLNLDTSESIKLPTFKGNTFANVRKLSLSHDSNSSQLKLSLTKFGTTKSILKTAKNIH